MNDLSLDQINNDLVIGLANSNDTVTVGNWYANANNQLDSIEVGSHELTTEMVAQLVQAQATFNVGGAEDGGSSVATNEDLFLQITGAAV